MRLFRLWVTLATALLVALSLAQSPAPPFNPDKEADWLEGRLVEAMSGRHTLGKATLADHPFHYVFLFDSSQTSSKSAYRKYVQTTIEEFLARRLEEPGGPQSFVSVYPYQVDLYTASPHYIDRERLSTKTVGEIGSVLPASPFDFAPETSRFGHASSNPKDYQGHDHINARQVAVKLVRQSDDRPATSGQVPTIYFQFTPKYFSEVPGHQEIDKEIRNTQVDSRTAGLEGTDLVPYNVDPNPRLSEFQSEAEGRIKVYVWLYGPASFSNVLTVKATAPIKHDPTPQPPKPVRQEPTPNRSWIGWLLLAAAVAAGTWFLTKPVRVTVAQGTRELYSGTVRPWQFVGIYGPGARKTGPHSVVLPPEIAMNAGPDLLAKVMVRPTGTYVEGHLCGLQGPGVQNGRFMVDGRRTFQLKSKDGSVVSSGILVKIS